MSLVVMPEEPFDPDLSAWPVLRLDQLPEIDSETLRKALSEVEDLLGSGGELGPLEGYLRRQAAAIARLVTQREARARVDRLLRGESADAEPEKASSPPPGGEGERSAGSAPESTVVACEPTVRFQPPRRSVSKDGKDRRRLVLGEQTTFVVEAVERRRRPPPQRPVSLPREEVLRRDRLARRAAALERLAARRERTEAVRTRTRRAPREKPEPSAEPFDDSSESEEVSDVDDADDLDESMRQLVDSAERGLETQSATPPESNELSHTKQESLDDRKTITPEEQQSLSSEAQSETDSVDQRSEAMTAESLEGNEAGYGPIERIEEAASKELPVAEEAQRCEEVDDIGGSISILRALETVRSLKAHRVRTLTATDPS